MKKSLIHIILVLSTLLAVACFDGSEVDVFSENKLHTVIEGIITDTGSTQSIKLFKTVEYNQPFEKYPISDAQVTIRINNDSLIFFEESRPGIYELSNFSPSVGYRYSLEVSDEDVLYTAEDEMPPAVIIDSTSIVFIENEDYYEDGHYILIYARRPKEGVNYYKIEVTVNDSLYNGYEDLIILDDSYTTTNQEQLLPYPFQLEDLVRVDIISISENMYDYYYGVAQLTNDILGSVSSPIINPPTNLSNNALGYFQVSSVVTLQVDISD